MSRAMVRYRPYFGAALVLALGLGVSACESLDKMNPFKEKEVPLTGDRKPLFPEGVPGVQFGAPPSQPTNSNIPINPPAAGDQQQSQQQQVQQPQQARAPQPSQPAPSQPTKTKSKGGDPNDAWSGTR
jgi:hypothetical protein